ncbi:MAG: tetratricopeptide repeat protein [Bacteroidales bacterium]|nr:tetratricopeptide repeat protein [Bacteroidales bacterium]
MKAGIVSGIILLFLMSSCGGDPTKKAIDLKIEGINLLQNSQFDAALEKFEKSLSYNDQDPETYYYIGNVWYGKKDTDKAFEYFSKAIEVDSTFSKAYVNRGKIYSMRNDKDNACKDWLKAESLGEKNLREDTKFCK